MFEPITGRPELVHVVAAHFGQPLDMGELHRRLRLDVVVPPVEPSPETSGELAVAHDWQEQIEAPGRVCDQAERGQSAVEPVVEIALSEVTPLAPFVENLQLIDQAEARHED